MSAFVRPPFRISLSSYGIANAALFDGSTSKATITLTTSATHSGYVLFSKMKNGAVQPIIGTSSYFNASDQLVINGLTSTAVFRDPTAFYLLFWNGTSAYIATLGSAFTAITGTGTYATASIVNPILGSDNTNFFYGIMSNFAFWNGTSESQTGISVDTATQNPIPTLPAGIGHTFLQFANSGSMGANSGSGGAWTPTALTQVTSTPTNVYATMNPLDLAGTTVCTFSNGNLTVTKSSAGNAQDYSSLRMDDNTGVYYAQIIAGADIAELIPGIITGVARPASNRYLGQDATTYAFYNDGRKVNNASYTAYGSAWVSTDRVGIELDTDNGTVSFSINGTDQGVAFSGLSGPYFFANSCESGGIGTWVFEDADLTSIPSGAKSLCTDNLPARSPKVPSTPQTGTIDCNGTTNNAFIPLGMVPDKDGTSTVDGVTLVPGTNCLYTATGVKLISASFTGSLSYSIAVSAYTGGSNVPPANAQVNP